MGLAEERKLGAFGGKQGMEKREELRKGSGSHEGRKRHAVEAIDGGWVVDGSDDGYWWWR